MENLVQEERKYRSGSSGVAFAGYVEGMLIRKEPRQLPENPIQRKDKPGCWHLHPALAGWTA